LQKIHSLGTQNSLLNQDLSDINDANDKLKEEIGEAIIKTVIK